MSEVTSAAFGDKFKLGRILLQHANELPAIVGYAEEIASATTLTGKWEAFKQAGDLLIPIGEELRAAYSTLGVVTMADLEAHAIGLGIDWAAFLVLLPKIMHALQLLFQALELFSSDGV